MKIVLIIVAIWLIISVLIRLAYKKTIKNRPERGPHVKAKTKDGGGSIVQIIGVILLFCFFPIGLLIGVFFIAIGASMARGFICSECGNKISSKDVKICPVCKADFSEKPSPQPENKNISTQRMQPATDPVKTEPDHQKKLDQKIEFKFS